MGKAKYISVIVTTYNWATALDCVLNALGEQKKARFEVIVADDGSDDTVANVVKTWQARALFPLIHCWQPDEGFRAAMIRNRAVALAQGDYLIFLDGDCIPSPYFVYRHQQWAEKGWFVAGHRVLLNVAFTEKVLANHAPIMQRSWPQWWLSGLKGECNRWFPKLRLPLGILRKSVYKKWQGAKTCNLGMWRDDFLKVNGFDEAFVGWGFEDSDLIIRLQRLGIKRKTGKYGTEVMHLWHPLASKEKVAINFAHLQKTVKGTHVQAALGVCQYARSHSN